MKKTLLAIILTFFVASFLTLPVAQATDVTKIVFGAYSSASSVTCYTWGMGERVKTEASYKNPIQAFAPDPLYSKAVSLGTGGQGVFGRYSTVYGNRHLTYVQFTCVVAGGSTAAPVKVYLNATSNAVFMPVASGIGGYAIGY